MSSKTKDRDKKTTQTRLDQAVAVGASRMVNIDLIDPDPNQPRRELGDLSELMESINVHGIISPIIVSIDGERFRLIVGERRYTAAKRLGLREVPALIRSMESHKCAEVQLIENVQRKDLEPIELARAYKRLIDEHQLSQRELARRLGKSASSINETLRILTLDKAELTQTSASHVSRSVLVELAKKTPAQRKTLLAESAGTEGLTVKSVRSRRQRQVRNAVTFQSNRHGLKITISPTRPGTHPDVKACIAALEEWLAELESEA